MRGIRPGICAVQSKIVKKNRDALIEGLKCGKGKNFMHLIPSRRGLHLALLLDKNINDVTLEAKRQKAGFASPAISHYRRNERENGLFIRLFGLFTRTL